MKVLCTGFAPFGGETINPSWQAVQQLSMPKRDIELIKAELPVSFHRATEETEKRIRNIRPDAVLLTGQAGGRKDVTVEKVALRLWDASLPDNDGFQPQALSPCPGAPDAFFATVPVEKIVQDARAAGLAISRSLSAGSYVCNAVYYAALHTIHQSSFLIPCVFVHVPYVPEQVEGKEMPSMELALMTQCLEWILEKILRKKPQKPG